MAGACNGAVDWSTRRPLRKPLQDALALRVLTMETEDPVVPKAHTDWTPYAMQVRIELRPTPQYGLVQV